LAICQYGIKRLFLVGKQFSDKYMCLFDLLGVAAVVIAKGFAMEQTGKLS
jgi:hypothetical protein